MLPLEIQIGLTPFRSLLLRGSLLISFHPFTKMFQFKGFAFQIIKSGTLGIQKGSLKGSPIRASSDQRSHAPTWGISQLDTPFIATQAYPSTKRRLRVVRSFYTITQLYMTIIVACTTTSFTLQYLKSCIYQYKLFNNLSWTALH